MIDISIILIACLMTVFMTMMMAKLLGLTQREENIALGSVTVFAVIILYVCILFQS